MSKNEKSIDLDKIVSLCKRRGFMFQSSEIYGGLASTWDYGPLGVEMKRNVKNTWWQNMVWDRDDMVGLDSAIMMHSDVWRASGHIDNFSDPLVECKSCHRRWRVENGTFDSSESNPNLLCPSCNGEMTTPRVFNLMFKTHMGPIEEDSNIVYLRPETAQGIFVNFNNVLSTTRRKLPFGIAQIGKAFRNEITTGSFIFRTREFEMMEIEYFVPPEQANKWHEKWVDDATQWYTSLGINEKNLRVRAHATTELAHYSKATHDIEYCFPWGWGEIQGIANRADYDLNAHSKPSGESLTYFDDTTNKHYVPHVIEPSAGVDRSVMAFLVDAYTEETITTSSSKVENRVLLKLHPSLAPVKVAILPLSKNEQLIPLARQVYDNIRRSKSIQGAIHYDEAQSIGRRYRRQDEIGTPLCVTIDFDSLQDDAVTIRERDSMSQTRVSIDTLEKSLNEKISS